MKDVAKLKVAVVHDFMVGGGAEQVVEQLLFMYPEAPLYTSCISPRWAEKLSDRDVRTGVLNAWFFQKTRKFIPLFRRWWFESLDLTEFDLVISSSGAEAKGVKKLKKGAVHVNYCHSPTHYYWVRYDEYFKHPGFGVFDPIARVGLRLLVGTMRAWDYKAAQRPDVMVANSTCVQERIKKYYDRESVVVFPPVDTERFKLSSARRAGFVIAGRQTPYKRIDLAILACKRGNVPLKVIGNGPENERLRTLGGSSIEFLTNVTDEQMPKYFGTAEAFIFPNEDDFGIVPVEAMATGTPVIAFKKGGALDYVRDNLSGVFFEKQTSEALFQAIQEFRAQKLDPNAVRQVAKEFSNAEFKLKMKRVIDKAFM